MAEPERTERRLRPAPLLFEPSEAATDPEHFFDLERIEDPRELLARATELTLAFRAAQERAVEFQALAAAQLADPRRFDRLSCGGDRGTGGVDRGLRPQDDRVRRIPATRPGRALTDPVPAPPGAAVRGCGGAAYAGRNIPQQQPPCPGFR